MVHQLFAQELQQPVETTVFDDRGEFLTDGQGQAYAVDNDIDDLVLAMLRAYARLAKGAETPARQEAVGLESETGASRRQ